MFVAPLTRVRLALGTLVLIGVAEGVGRGDAIGVGHTLHTLLNAKSCKD